LCPRGLKQINEIPMNSTDRSKLIKAGFRVMRASPVTKSITELNAKEAWILVSRHDTISSMKKAVAALRTEQQTIFEFDE